MQLKTIQGIEVLIEGTGPDTILMLHGWPDTRALWDTTAAALSPHYRCVRFTWPGFEPGAPRKEHSLDELIGLCEHVVREVSPEKPVTLLVHDWGCLFGYQFAMRHPDRVQRIVGIDIGDAGSKAHLDEIGLKGKLGIVSYQLWLAAAWRIGGGIGESMSRSMAKKFRVPIAPEALTVEKNYPYWSTWTGKYKAVKPFRPLCPMLFVYGTRKPFNFHSRVWEAELNGKPGSRAVAMDTDHWPMVRQPEAFHRIVLEWLGTTTPTKEPHALPADL